MTVELSVEQSAVAARIRRILTTRPQRIREVQMFGGLSFMVDEEMAVAARRDGSLLVRIDPARYVELLDAGGAPALMGPDRAMGHAWLTVAASQTATDTDLTRWIEVGVDARRSRN